MRQEKIYTGPYREPSDPNALALENMRRRIEAEGKCPLLIPEGIGEDDVFEGFFKLLKNKKNNPKDIALYSVATGILKYKETSPLGKRIDFIVYTGSNNDSELVVILHKDEIPPFRVYNLRTKADTEKNLAVFKKNTKS